MLFFISSTFRDLREERDAVQAVLRSMSAVPWGMEFYVSEPTTPIDVCLRELRNCGAVLLIIGDKAGSLVPGAPGLTYTRAEIEEALRLGRPIFAFMKTDGGSLVNKETHPDNRKALDEFRAFVSSAPITPAYFGNLDQLKVGVATAIARWNEQGRPGARQTFAEAEPAPHAAGVQPLFDFGQIFRGRAAELKSLNGFLTDPAKLIAIVPGRGGIGKTKLLREFAAQAAGWTQLWVSSIGVWHKETEKEMPSGNVLIIADDGHRFDELGRLVGLVEELAGKRNIKLVISSRPSGLNWVNELVARVSDETKVERIKALEPLQSKDALALAEEVLGAGHAGLAPVLAEISRDTPLVTVVGGRLLASGKLLPAALGNEEGFRRAVLDKFTEECEGLLLSGGRSKRELLHLVAAVQPISPAYLKGFADSASEFVGGVRPDQILQGLNGLEAGGVLIRTRGGVRIAPDVLGDYLLETACVNDIGESTGYAKAAFVKFRDPFLANLVRNLAELDWRIAQKHTDSELLDEIWTQLAGEFKEANAADRCSVLDAMRPIVPFQPPRVLELVRIAMDTNAEAAKVFFLLVEQDDVLGKVPALLGWIAFAREATEEAVNRLWRLTKMGGRVAEEAQGSLKGLIAYRKYKDVDFNDRMMGLVEELAKLSDAFDGSFSPLDLADEVLDREVDYTETSGRAISFGSLPLNYLVVKGVRDRAFKLVEELLGSGNPRASTRAARSLGQVLAGFLPKMGRTLPEGELGWQNEERLRAVAMIRERVARGDAPVPLVRTLRNTLRRLVRRHIDTPVLKAIEEAVDAIPESDEVVLLDALCTGPWDRDVEVDDIHLATKRVETQRRRAVAVLRNLKRLPVDQVTEIKRLVEEALAYGIEIKGAGEFVQEMSSDRQFLDALQEHLTQNEDSVLGPLATSVLLELRKVDRKAFGEFGRKKAGSQNVVVADAVARAVCYGPNLDSPMKEDVEILIELAKRREPRVLYTTFFGLGRLGKFGGRLQPIACELAAQVALDGDPKLAEEFCEMFVSRGLDPDALNNRQIEKILAKLLPVAELADHGVGPFLNWISGREPELLVDFLVTRLERYRQLRQADETTDYEPFPLSSRGNIQLAGIRATAAYEPALRRVRGLVLAYPEEVYWIVPLFWLFGTVDSVTFGVLDEWLHAGSAEKIEGMLKLLAGAPPFIASHPFFAIHLAEEAAQVSQDWADKMIRRLASNSLSTSFGYGIPSPIGNAHEKAIEMVPHFPEGSPAHRLFTELIAHKESWARQAPMIDDAVLFEEFE